jgi:hypothetical protein
MERECWREVMAQNDGHVHPSGGIWRIAYLAQAKGPTDETAAALISSPDQHEGLPRRVTVAVGQHIDST